MSQEGSAESRRPASFLASSYNLLAGNRAVLAGRKRKVRKVSDLEGGCPIANRIFAYALGMTFSTKQSPLRDVTKL